MRSSHLPAVKTLADFDFSFQPSIKREEIDSLHELGFVGRSENIVVLGPPGVGKTHLAISLAISVAEHGRRVYYGTLVDLIDSLEEAKAAGRLNQRLKVLTHPALLVVDEIGCRPPPEDHPRAARNPPCRGARCAPAHPSYATAAPVQCLAAMPAQERMGVGDLRGSGSACRSSVECSGRFA